MNLPFHIPQDTLVAQCLAIRDKVVQISEPMVFTAMHNAESSFVVPLSPTDYPAKHQEIEEMLAYRGFPFNGLSLSLLFTNQMLIELENGGHNVEQVISNLAFQLPDDAIAHVLVEKDKRWKYKSTITVRIPNGGDDERRISFGLIDPLRGILVPDYVAQYLHAAQQLYRQRIYQPCLALCSIVLEAILSDVLEHKGIYGTNVPNPLHGVAGAPLSHKVNFTVEGLATLLIVARHHPTHNFLRLADLPSQFDSVLRLVRNKLVHLSGAVLNTPIPELNNFSQISNFTLGHFLQSPVLIGDVLCSMTKLADKIYERMRNGTI